MSAGAPRTWAADALLLEGVRGLKLAQEVFCRPLPGPNAEITHHLRVAPKAAGGGGGGGGYERAWRAGDVSKLHSAEPSSRSRCRNRNHNIVWWRFKAAVHCGEADAGPALHGACARRHGCTPACAVRACCRPLPAGTRPVPCRPHNPPGDPAPTGRPSHLPLVAPLRVDDQQRPASLLGVAAPRQGAGGTTHAVRQLCYITGNVRARRVGRLGAQQRPLSLPSSAAASWRSLGLHHSFACPTAKRRCCGALVQAPPPTPAAASGSHQHMQRSTPLPNPLLMQRRHPSVSRPTLLCSCTRQLAAATSACAPRLHVCLPNPAAASPCPPLQLLQAVGSGEHHRKEGFVSWVQHCRRAKVDGALNVMKVGPPFASPYRSQVADTHTQRTPPGPPPPGAPPLGSPSTPPSSIRFARISVPGAIRRCMSDFVRAHTVSNSCAAGEEGRERRRRADASAINRQACMQAGRPAGRQVRTRAGVASEALAGAHAASNSRSHAQGGARWWFIRGRRQQKKQGDGGRGGGGGAPFEASRGSLEALCC